MAQFRPVPAKVDFPAQERETLWWWRDERMIERYIRRNASSPVRRFFLDGPITASNPMGVHHDWGRTYKDLFQRYHTMLGQRQCYQNGFDVSATRTASTSVLPERLRRQCYQNGFDGQGLWVEVEGRGTTTRGSRA